MQLLLKTKFIIVLIVILISLSACAKDYQLNPLTTILNQLIKANYGTNTIKRWSIHPSRSDKGNDKGYRTIK